MDKGNKNDKRNKGDRGDRGDRGEEGGDQEDRDIIEKELPDKMKKKYDKFLAKKKPEEFTSSQKSLNHSKRDLSRRSQQIDELGDNKARMRNSIQKHLSSTSNLHPPSYMDSSSKK